MLNKEDFGTYMKTIHVWSIINEIIEYRLFRIRI
jgi:hypothetical protein